MFFRVNPTYGVRYNKSLGSQPVKLAKPDPQIA